MAKSSDIEAELRSLTKLLKHQGHKNASNEAHRLINLKYGKGWREEYKLISHNSNPKLYVIGKMSYY